MSRDIILGLCDPPKRIFLFISRAEDGSGSCWYMRDFDRDINTPIPQRAIKGYISGIRITATMISVPGKPEKVPKDKLDVFIDCGELSYALRCGSNTEFARGLVQALIAIEDPEELKGVLTIETVPGDKNKKVVFASVYITATGQKVKYTDDKVMNLHDPVKFLQSVWGNGGEADDDYSSDAQRDAGVDQQRDERSSESLPVSTEEEKRHQLQVRELKRVGALAGLAFEPGTAHESLVELNSHCGAIYKNVDGSPKTIEQLTRDEAIKYRKTLLGL